MTDVGQLVIRLEAETASLTRGLNAARRAIDQNMSASEKSIAALQSTARKTAVAIGNIGAAIGVGAMVAYAKSVIDTVGGLGELADQLGVTTEQLQALQYTALAAGASAETLETGIARLTRSIGEAGEGNDALIRRFRDLGVSLLDVNGKQRDTGDVLSDVAKGIAGIEDPAKRAAAVVDFFGKSGQKLLPLLMEIADVGLAGIARKAREAGAVIDSEAIKRFDELSDKAAQLGKVGFVAVADGLAKIVEYINNLDKSKAALLASVVAAGAGAVVAGPVGAGFAGGYAGMATYQNWPGGPDRAKQLAAEEVELNKRITALLTEQMELRGNVGRLGTDESPLQSRLRAISAELDRIEKRKNEILNELAPAPPAPVGPAASESNPAVSASPNGVAPLLPVSTRELTNQAAGDALVRSLQLQKDSYGQIESAVLRLRLERERDIAVIDGQIKDLGPKYSKAQIDAAVAIQQQVEALVELRRAQLDAGATAAAQAAEREKERAASAEWRNQQVLVAQKVEESIAQTRAQIPLVEQSTIVWNKHTRQFELVNEQLDLYLAKQRLMAANPGMKPDDVDRLARDEVEAAKKLKEATDEQTAAVQRQQATYDFLANMGERAFDRIGDAMVDMAMNGKDALSSLTNVARAVVASIYADFMKLAIANPIKNALFGGNSPTLSDGGGIFKGLFGGSQAAGGPTDAATGMVGTTGLSFGGPRAKGGRVSPGNWYMVGEEGPEPFVPDVAGRIFPHDAGGGGRGGDTFYIDAKGADKDGLRRLETLIHSVNGSVEKRAVMAVTAARQRGAIPA